MLAVKECCPRRACGDMMASRYGMREKAALQVTSPKTLERTAAHCAPKPRVTGTTRRHATAPDVTQLLRAWSDGDKTALDQLVPLVESELRRLARACMSRERRDHTLQATALVNEAFLRFTDARDVRWQDRAHFMGIAARLMRRILVDHARRAWLSETRWWRGTRDPGRGAARGG